MVVFKLNISDVKTGKSKKLELSEDQSKGFMGRKIGMTVKGELIDLTGYEFEITGGSDSAGFPMRKDVPGTGRKRILAVKGIGLKKFNKKFRKNKVTRKSKGIRQRKTVRGNTISSDTAQINVKILTAGKKSLWEEAQPEAPAEGAEAPKAQEEKKE